MGAGEKHSKQSRDIGCGVHGVCSDKGRQKEVNVRSSLKKVNKCVTSSLFRQVRAPVSVRYGKEVAG